MNFVAFYAKVMLAILWFFVIPQFLIATDVKDFGAIGDGVHDDTEAIYKAIQSAKDGELFFSKGTYRISKSITIDLSSYGPQLIRGVAGGSTIKMDGPGAAFVVKGNHHGSALPSSVQQSVWDKEKFFTVKNLEIVGLQENSDGIQLHNLMQPTVKNCLIRNVRYGIHLTSRNRNVLLLGNHIYDCTRIGVYLDRLNLHQININDNHISYCNEGGIVVRNSEIRNIQIVGNDIEYNFDENGAYVSADIFFDVSETGSIREGTISSNTIQALESRGGANLHFIGSQENRLKIGLLSITGNHISNQETLIKMVNVKGISITGNTFIRGYEHHISIEAGDNIVIQGNVFDHNRDYFGASVKSLGGIRLASCRDIVFDGNIVEGVSRGSGEMGAALEIDQSDRITVSASHFTNPVFRGIEITQSDNVAVYGCRFHNDNDTMIDGILVRGQCENLDFENNQFGPVQRDEIHGMED